MKMATKLSTRRALGLLLLSAAFALARPQGTHKAAKVPAKPVAAAASAAQQDPGERSFLANCSRCHAAPEALSPRISGTVLMHMRVRASLSAKDEQAILHFLAP